MKRCRLRPVLLLGFFFLLGLLFVPECDDCYFVYWHFASLRDMLLTRPITEGMPVVGVPANGRYLGNFLGVLQGKLYFTPFGFLRGLLFGGALAGLTLLLGRRFSDRGEGGVALAFSLVVLAPRGIWQQVYSWGAGFVNYLLPMIGILILLELLNRERPAPWACFLLTLCCCLFLEPVTILLCLSCIVFFLCILLRDQSRRTAALAAGLGAVLGTLVMFTSPGYAQVNSDTRTMGLELIQRNLTVIMTDALIRPAAVTALISVLLVLLLRRQGSAWKPWAAVLAPIHLVCIADTLRDCVRGYGSYTTKRLLLACLLAGLWVVMLALWQGGRTRFQVVAGVLALCALNGPLLVVSPVESRNLFPSYVILVVIAALLWREVGGVSFLRLAWVPGLLACVVLIGVYGANFAVYHQRLDSARAQAAQGVKEMTLPLVPFPGWAVNEQAVKGDICYLVYREEPWDVSFQFVPYGEF
ncbi:hypothetical protein D1646_00415 [Pseudoflavonifractor sp. 60]|uniref:hypothetical protein n=1 Tax=Pseudoflavonifractor sp. 60 TaxID=2304576 RepID=UPI00136E3688|nr:hypothetical protein [Pseudoflavonifractor sp. 60]NBI65292.1 hypothetical protein [Pseudoflavonifractor sp. 60]